MYNRPGGTESGSGYNDYVNQQSCNQGSGFHNIGPHGGQARWNQTPNYGCFGDKVDIVTTSRGRVKIIGINDNIPHGWRPLSLE